MAKNVKCNSCNVIIDELLAYMQHKIDVIDEVSLIQICKSAFNAADIEQSKAVLNECIAKNAPTTTGRLRTRRGEGKEQRDIEDIIR